MVNSAKAKLLKFQNKIFNCNRFFNIAKNKRFEFQTMEFDEPEISFSFSWTFKCDHAGIHYSMEVYKLFVSLAIYDTRHWDEIKGKYYE